MGEKGQVWGLVIRAGEACEEHEGPHCTKSGLGKSPKEALDGENPGILPRWGWCVQKPTQAKEHSMHQASQEFGPGGRRPGEGEGPPENAGVGTVTAGQGEMWRVTTQPGETRTSSQ